MTADLELLTVGRIGVDLYAEQLHVPLREVVTFRKSVGGTATNVAVACARLGHRTAVFTKVGADAFGDYVEWALRETFGVDTSFIGRHPTLRTPLAFAELQDPGEPVIVFYREPAAPDSTIATDEVDLDVVRSVSVLWIPGGCFAFEPSRSTVRTLLAERGRRAHTVLDLDWRPALWASLDEGPAQMSWALDHATMAIGNRAECEIAVGTADPELAADRLLDRGLTAAIVKMGGDGVLVATADGVRERIAPHPVDVVCGLGAGDAFGGAICHGLLAGLDLVDSARMANIAGAIVASRLMCADDMPYLHELSQPEGEQRISG
jgi:5-dehydro-2-deoxygluconokinase